MNQEEAMTFYNNSYYIFRPSKLTNRSCVGWAMEVSTEYTKTFLESMWFQYGASIIDKICSEYEISEEIKMVLYQKYLRPNDWQLQIN